MRLNKMALACMVLGGSALLAACGGGSDAPATPVKTVSGSTTATINPTTGAALASAVAGNNFSFAAGVPFFGTTGPTTLGITSSGGTPGFNVTSSQGTASGGLGFGSCIFNVSATSTFPASSPLGPNKQVVVSPCALSLNTAGKLANGVPTPTGVSFVLGTATSSEVTINVAISDTGLITINGIATGVSATLTGPTGATGAGG